MLRRIAPLLLALAVAGAPIALELCHIACASRSPQADAHTGAGSGAAHVASCHDATDSPAPVSLRAHPCDHADDLPTPAGIESARQSKFTTSLATATLLVGSIAGTPMRTQATLRSRRFGPSPARADRILPLRI